MKETWVPIDRFPQYSISDHGKIRNDDTGRILVLSENQYGVVCVGLMRNGVQRHRSVAKLVAQTFIPSPARHFDTPINLDGDRHNNHVDNLVWRPRWFAVMYNRQFRRPYPNPIEAEILDPKTGEISKNSFDCATRYGLLEKDVVLSILNRTYVVPTFQEFQVLA